MGIGLLVELLVFLAARQWINLATEIDAVAAALPQMPFLGYAYLRFAVVVVLLFWLKLRGAKLSDYGFRKFGPAWLFAVIAAAATMAHLIVPSVLDTIIAQYFDKTRDISRFAAMRGDFPLFLYVTGVAWVTAALGEEVFYRGFILETVRKILGDGRIGMIIAIFVQAALFGAAHIYQGLAGAIPIAVGAVVTGFLYWAGGRRLWPLMLAHGLVDTLGFWMIYTGAMR